MKFIDIVGHKALTSRMRQSVREGRVPHAQLFSGEAGYGILPLALAYAQYLNCGARSEEDSCGTCPSCIQMQGLAHPDVHIVLPVNKQGKKSGETVLSGEFMPLLREQMERCGGYLSAERWSDALDLGKTLKAVISVKEADEIIRQLSFKSFSGGYKVMIVFLPETMNEQAANKLLKILEEPWERTVFLFVSESPELLISTIISRLQQLALPRIDTAAMEEYAQKRYAHFDSERKTAAVRLAAGDLIELKRLFDGGGDTLRGEYFDMFTTLMRKSYNDQHLDLLDWADSVAKRPMAEQIAFLNYSLNLLRDAYCRHAGLADLCYTWGEEAQFCTKFAPFIGNENIEFLMQHIEESITQLRRNINPSILFAHFALRVSKEIRKR